MGRQRAPPVDAGAGEVAVIHVGSCLDILPTLAAESVQTCITSPPYFGLRDYGCDGQIGLEPTPDDFVAALVAVFREVRRVLRDDGTLWLNLGDSYAGAGYSNHANTGGAMREDGGKQKHLTGSGLKNKDLIGIPWRVAFALQADGWYLRQDIIWAKPNPMPESVRDRCTKAHEYLFLLSKGPRYFYDADAIAEDGKDWSKGGPGTGIQETQHYGAGNGGNAGLSKLAARYKDADGPVKRNKRSVWTVPVMPFREAHFATYPERLIEPCVLAGSRPGDVVLDPFLGAGTTAVVAQRLGREWVGCELNPDYAAIAEERIRATQPGLPLEAA
jgi:DNA modification methylase